MARGTHDNENEPLTFQTLAAATAKLLNRIEKQNEERTSDGDAEQRSESSEEAHRKYVDQRLRELRNFERRASGNQKPR